jgi:hypothetical protein
MVQLKHTTTEYIREISMGRAFFAERCNSILRGKEVPQAKAHLKFSIVCSWMATLDIATP